MKKTIFSLIAGLICCLTHQRSFAQAGNAGFHIENIGSETIPLTTNKMTNIVFPSPIKPGIKISRDILAERPRATTNVLVLKAARKGFAATNLSVYGYDGRLYSFELRYTDNPPVLNFRVVGDGVKEKMPLEKEAEAIETEKGFMHRSVRAGRMRLTLRGIYIDNGMMWFSLWLKNNSGIDYSPESVRWVIRDRRRLKRTAIQEMAARPEYEDPVLSVPEGSSRNLVAGFRPFTLGKDKMLVVQAGERDGRVLTLKILNAVLLRSKLVKHEE